MNQPKSIALTVYSDFRASHSLVGNEIPHFHLWKLALEFRSALPLANDRLIDLVFLQKQVEEITCTIHNRNLNETLPTISPTSENLAQWLWEQFSKKNPSAPLVAVTVTLCDLTGHATGSARIE